jgi:hypothetical protein
VCNTANSDNRPPPCSHRARGTLPPVTQFNHRVPRGTELDRDLSPGYPQRTTAFKMNLHASITELVYDEPLKNPGDLLTPTSDKVEPVHFITQLRLRPIAAALHTFPATFVQKDLQNLTHVFLRQNAIHWWVHTPVGTVYTPCMYTLQPPIVAVRNDPTATICTHQWLQSAHPCLVDSKNPFGKVHIPTSVQSPTIVCTDPNRMSLQSPPTRCLQLGIFPQTTGEYIPPRWVTSSPHRCVKIYTARWVQSPQPD